MARTAVQGRVAAVRSHTTVNGYVSQSGGGVSSYEALSFVVRGDGQRGGVPVEWQPVGSRIRVAPVQEGDYVRVDGRRKRSYVQAQRIQNATTGLTVRGIDRNRLGLTVLLVFLLLAGAVLAGLHATGRL